MKLSSAYLMAAFMRAAQSVDQFFELRNSPQDAECVDFT